FEDPGGSHSLALDRHRPAGTGSNVAGSSSVRAAAATGGADSEEDRAKENQGDGCEEEPRRLVRYHRESVFAVLEDHPPEPVGAEYTYQDDSDDESGGGGRPIAA
ncbi:unnamed protein product, partial [Phaeothamnion confervicola]